MKKNNYLKPAFALIGFILFSLTLSSCMSLLYTPCMTQKDPDKIDNRMMPIKQGNYWKYKFTSNKIDTTFTIEYKIGKKFKIKVPKRYKLKYIYAYEVLVNNKKSNYIYFKCDGITTLATFNSSGIEMHNTFLENPKNRDNDPLWYKYYWYWPLEVKTIAGNFRCWVIEDEGTIGDNVFADFTKDPYTAKNKISIAIDVGIVKSELIDQFGNILSYIELVEYKVN